MEMKKSYSPFGSTSLSVDEVLPDIQTGRAVYPDKDKEADASYIERINQYKHEGFHDVSEDGGSSSGGGDSSSGGGTSEPLFLRAIVEDTSVRLDKTFGEIKEAFNSGRPIWLADEETTLTLYTSLSNIGIFEEGGGGVTFVSTEYTVETDSDYPSTPK